MVVHFGRQLNRTLVINAGWVHHLILQMRAHENNLFDNRCTNINLYKKIIDLQNQQTIISTMLYYNIFKKI